LITNVGPAHLEKLRDLDGVAAAKGELFLWIKTDATAVVNMDDARIAAMPTQAKRRVTYGSGPAAADICLKKRVPAGEKGQELVLDIQGERVEAPLPLIGAHNAKNALAAAAAAVAVGLGRDEITAGLAAVGQEPGRLALYRTSSGRLIIDDTYNANPASMRAALAALLELPVQGQRVAVLGDMLELGSQSEREHRSLGRYAAERGIDLLVTMGKLGELIDLGAAEAGLSEDRRSKASSHEHAAELALAMTGEGDALLVKGSHGMQMDRVVAELKKREE
jgi:UDP-N-acetylmuramoyl-tripeptide--D-alanyl-D-alanine ligase